MHFFALLSVFLTAAGPLVCAANIVCDDKPYGAQDYYLTVRGVDAPLYPTVYGRVDKKSKFRTAHKERSGVEVDFYRCTSSYLGINETGSLYGLLAYNNAFKPITAKTKCIAAKFDAGSKDTGILVSQTCSLKDDKSQLGQFFYWASEDGDNPDYYRLVGDLHGKPFNPEKTGHGYSFSAANDTGAVVHFKWGKNTTSLLSTIEVIES